MKDDKNEMLETLDAMNANLKSGVLALVAIAMQIRDNERGEAITSAQLESAAEVLRLSATVLKPMF
jgi:hypothetical protein